MVVILRQASANCNLMVKSSLSPVFINTVLLELGHAYSFIYACACFPAIAGVGNGSESLEYLLSSLLHSLLILVYGIEGNWLTYLETPLCLGMRKNVPSIFRRP